MRFRRRQKGVRAVAPAPDPDWKITWLGHPSGFPRYVRVTFLNDAEPRDARQAGLDLASRLQQATTEGLFNNAVLAFAEAYDLRVIDVITGPDHTHPGGDAISVAFEKAKPPTVTIIE